MLVFNFVQSDMAFLPVVAPDSFIEVATLRAMKIPTGWNENSVHLCAASKYRFHQDFSELR